MKNGDYILIVPPEDYPGKKYRGRYAYEHHVVWWLNTGEVVNTAVYDIHHKDENKHHNVFSNLEKKLKFHHKSGHQKPAPIVDIVCVWCGETYQLESRIYKEKIKLGQTNFFCCRSHQVSHQQTMRRKRRID